MNKILLIANLVLFPITLGIIFWFITKKKK